MRRSIPQDICNEVIDRLYNDFRTLRACALVCHGWLPTARTYLFYSVSLRRWEGPEKLSYAESVLTTAVAAASQCRRLELSGFYDLDEVEDAKIIRMIPLFCCVNNLHIQTNQLALVTPALLKSVVESLMPQITSLTLIAIRDLTMTDLLTWISAANLRHISIEGTNPSLQLAEGTSFFGSPSFIRELSLAASQIPIFFSWLRWTDLPPAIHTLKVNSMDSNLTSGISSALKYLGPMLRHLTVTYSAEIVGYKGWDISENVNLQTVDFHSNYRVNPTTQQWITTTLSVNKSNLLKKIFITCYLPEVEQIRGLLNLPRMVALCSGDSPVIKRGACIAFRVGIHHGDKLEGILNEYFVGDVAQRFEIIRVLP